MSFGKMLPLPSAALSGQPEEAGKNTIPRIAASSFPRACVEHVKYRLVMVTVAPVFEQGHAGHRADLCRHCLQSLSSADTAALAPIAGRGGRFEKKGTELHRPDLCRHCLQPLSSAEIERNSSGRNAVQVAGKIGRNARQFFRSENLVKIRHNAVQIHGKTGRNARDFFRSDSVRQCQFLCKCRRNAVKNWSDGKPKRNSHFLF